MLMQWKALQVRSSLRSLSGGGLAIVEPQVIVDASADHWRHVFVAPDTPMDHAKLETLSPYIIRISWPLDLLAFRLVRLERFEAC